MANDFATVADHLADAHDLAHNELEQLKESAPLLSRLPVVFPSNGDEHKYSVITQRPAAGFRSENAGRGADHAVDSVLTAALKILDYTSAVDKAVADAWRKGRADYVARDKMLCMKDAMFRMELQILSGTTNGGAAGGFAGLPENGNIDGIADDMVVNAGGTTASTGSSFYFLRVNEEEIAAIMTEEIEEQETIVQALQDSSQQPYTAYYTPGEAWAGLQYGSKFSCGRICNLTEESGKGLTDDLIYSLLAKFPAGKGPNLAVCSQRSAEQLRASRTATNVTGAPAPMPEFVGANIPLITSDGCGDTEAILS